MKIKKRKLELVVLSDTHLGTIGARAEELLKYLKSIEPETIVLNGDIIDIWQFSKRHWNKYHTRVVKQLLKFISSGVTIYYIVGNHDEALRRFLDFELEGLKISNKLSLNLDGKRAWFFHGDVFDVTMQHSRWLTKFGAIGYDFLILLNSSVNKVLNFFSREKLSFSKKIKNKVKAAVSYINKFEMIVADIGIQNKFDYVICGHIHQPCIKTLNSQNNEILYLNSGDWIENMTALEYNEKKWNLFYYNTENFETQGRQEVPFKKSSELFSDLVSEIYQKSSNP